MKKNHYKYSSSPKAGRIFILSICLTFVVFGLSAQERNLDVAAGNGQVTLSWDGNSAVDSVVVTGLRSISGSKSLPLTSPLDVEGLENGKLYAFEVYFHSTEWPIVDVGVLYAIPGETAVPRNLSATAGNASVTLSWQPPVEGKEYSYKLITETGDKKTLGSGLTSYTVNGLVNGQSYAFRIAAVQTFTDFPGKEKETWRQATIAGATPLIYVSPQAGQTTAIVKAIAGGIEVNAPEAGELKVFTLGGQPYLNRSLAQGSSFVAMPKGMYFVTFGKTTAKVSVN